MTSRCGWVTTASYAPVEITSSCFTYANYATTAMHNETSCDAQAHKFYNTL